MSVRKGFAALRGIAGALLGACLAARVFRDLLWGPIGDSPLEILVLVWGYFTFCPLAYLGYWCFRGLRNWRFGYGTAWSCAFLALPLATRLPSLKGWLGAFLVGGVFTMLSHVLGKEAFLRYLDPAWYRDPRRLAAKLGRGRLSGHWHISPPFGPPVPAAFDVKCGTTVLHVQGEIIRVEHQLRRGWSFSAGDVAGVIQAPGVGHCVPYNAQGQALAVFCLSEKNGELFAQYLRNRDIPFRRLDEVPPTGPLVPKEPEKPSPLGEAVWEAVSEYAAELEEQEVRHTDFSQYVSKDFRDFRLVLRRIHPIGLWVAIGLGLVLLLFFPVFPIVAICNGPYLDLQLNAMIAATVVFAVGPWVMALAVGELFPPRLSVENGRIWLDKDFRPLREIPAEDLGWLRWNRSDECYILYLKNGKPLLKFSTRDDGGPAFMNFLTDHNIRIRSEE